MEEWDIYDYQRSKTGRTHPMGTTMESGDYHLIGHLCLFNSKGEMLIQQRQSDKDKWPNQWDLTVAGKVMKGETSQQGLMRELKEELNLDIELEHIRPRLTVNFERGFDDIFIIEKDVNLDTLTLQKEEVQAVKWASEEEVMERLEKGEFINYYLGLIRLLFEMYNEYGYIHGEYTQIK